MGVNGKESPCVEAPLVLTQHEAAALLKVAPRQLTRMGVPRLDLGRKTKRYVRKDVLAWIEAQRHDAQGQGAAVARVPLT